MGTTGQRSAEAKQYLAKMNELQRVIMERQVLSFVENTQDYRAVFASGEIKPEKSTWSIPVVGWATMKLTDRDAKTFYVVEGMVIADTPESTSDRLISAEQIGGFLGYDSPKKHRRYRETTYGSQAVWYGTRKADEQKARAILESGGRAPENS